MSLRFRRAIAADIPRGLELNQSERAAFSPNLWNALPALLADLLERRMMLLCVVEDVATRELLMMAGSAFVTRAFLHRTRASDGDSVQQHLFDAAMSGEPVILNQKEVARANRAATLQCQLFFGTPDGLDPARPETMAIVGTQVAAFEFFHRGFQIADLWHEYSVPVGHQACRDMGLTEVRSVAVAKGQCAKWFHVRLRPGPGNVAAPLPSLINTAQPVLGLSRPQQQLLEYALLDYSDRELSGLLGVSADAVKKRWRTIYTRVSAVEPALLGAGLSGPDRRRVLLQRVRDNLQEIRPWE